MDESELKSADMLREQQKSADLEIALQDRTVVASLQQTEEELAQVKELLVAEREESSHKTAKLRRLREKYKKLKTSMSEDVNKMARQLQEEETNFDTYEIQVHV